MPISRPDSAKTMPNTPRYPTVLMNSSRLKPKLPTSDPRLRERNNGAAAGLTYAEASRRFPEACSELWTWDARPSPDSETWREFYSRVAGFLESLSLDGPLPVLVPHGGTAMNIVAWW